jgi:hypothetical protein
MTFAKLHLMPCVYILPNAYAKPQSFMNYALMYTLLVMLLCINIGSADFPGISDFARAVTLLCVLIKRNVSFFISLQISAPVW